jgi:hypothetical protein
MAKFTKHMTISYNQKTSQFALDFSEGLPAQLIIDMLLTALVKVISMILKNVPQSQKDMMNTDMYDRMNIAFTNILEGIIPSSEIPDLTEEAILEAENKIIKDAATSGMQLTEYLKKQQANRKPC